MRTTVILNVANTGPHMGCVWAFISRDAEGRENVCGAAIEGMGMQPLMTGNPALVESFKQIANQMRCHLADTGDTKTIHLIEFSDRKEIEF